MSDHRQDPARVSEETLHSFETDLPAPARDEEVPATPPLRRQGALILVGLAALIALGLATLLAWLF